MSDGTSWATSTAPPGGGLPGRDLAPGGPQAVVHGCLCSVLANAAFRAGASDDQSVDPRCPLHAASPSRDD